MGGNSPCFRLRVNLRRDKSPRLCRGRVKHFDLACFRIMIASPVRLLRQAQYRYAHGRPVAIDRDERVVVDVFLGFIKNAGVG